jgi:hypothetical protein
LAFRQQGDLKVKVPVGAIFQGTWALGVKVVCPDQDLDDFLEQSGVERRIRLCQSIPTDHTFGVVTAVKVQQLQIHVGSLLEGLIVTALRLFDGKGYGFDAAFYQGHQAVPGIFGIQRSSFLWVFG